MALSVSFVGNINKNKCCSNGYGYGCGYHFVMKNNNRNDVRKSSLLATFAQSALLMRYNELIHKKENNNKSIHTSLNACMKIKRSGRNVVASYKYKSKKLCNNNNNNNDSMMNTSCIMKNESTMTGTSFIASRSHICRSNNNKRSKNSSIRKCMNNVNVNTSISNDDVLRNSFVIQKIKLQQQQQQQQHKSMNVVKAIENVNSSCNSDKQRVCNLQMYKLDEVQGLSRFNAKKYKMISKYLDNQLHKGELCDDYLIGNCKPFDRFSNFKYESKMQYNVKENIILNLHEILSNNKDYLKLYSAGIKHKKYILTFKRHKSNKQ